jgi:hypothetical protein
MGSINLSIDKQDGIYRDVLHNINLSNKTFYYRPNREFLILMDLNRTLSWIQLGMTLKI